MCLFARTPGTSFQAAKEHKTSLPTLNFSAQNTRPAIKLKRGPANRFMRAIGGTNYVVFSLGMFISYNKKYKISLPELGNFVENFTFSKVPVCTGLAAGTIQQYTCNDYCTVLLVLFKLPVLV